MTVDKHSSGYFSFWSYRMYLECPYKYYLYFRENFRPDPLTQDKSDVFKGDIAHKLAEGFFKIAVKDRNINYFFDTIDVMMAEYLDTFSCLKCEFYELKQQARGCMENLVRIILSNNLVQADVESEVEFQVELNDKIAVGGRLDLVVHVDRTLGVVDLWDIKTGKTVYLEQLYFGGFWLKQRNLSIRRTGFLMLSSGKVRNSRLLDAGYNKLVAVLTDMKDRIDRNMFDPSFNWGCTRCEAQSACKPYRDEQDRKDQIRALPRGKVPFNVY